MKIYAVGRAHRGDRGLTAETDARDITMNRTIDALDLVSTMTYPNPNLNVTQSLSLQVGANPMLALAGPTTYEPFGPLARKRS